MPFGLKARERGSSAGVVFVGCAGSEFGQKLHVVPGHFDPFDLIAFGITVILCVFIDRELPFTEPPQSAAATVAGSGNDDLAPGTSSSILKEAGLKDPGQE